MNCLMAISFFKTPNIEIQFSVVVKNKKRLEFFRRFLEVLPFRIIITA
ncbi:hypothetical protein BN1002_01341 [Bacillus sp. B-jedd]|nr:hypothetical protein BN1002_01341 [Bacillus sp. B-jedd]